MPNIATPKTYIYKKVSNNSNSLSLPRIDKEIAKEYRPTVVYMDKVYTHNELLDKYSYTMIDVDNNIHEIQADPYETGLVYDEYSNFDALVENLKAKDYVALDNFTDFSWNWSSLVYRLSLLVERRVTFSAYNIYFDNPKDLLEIMQMGENYSLPFDETYIKQLLKLYKHHHKKMEYVRKRKPMESYKYEEGI